MDHAQAHPGNNVYLQTAVIALTYAVVEFMVEFLVASAAKACGHGLPMLANVSTVFAVVCLLLLDWHSRSTPKRSNDFDTRLGKPNIRQPGVDQLQD